MLIPLQWAKNLVNDYKLKQVLVIAYDGEQTQILTYGKTKKDCKEVAIAQEWWDGRVLPRADIINKLETLK